MFQSLTTKSPTEIPAEQRRKVWEAERILKIRQMVAAGEMTEAEARERGA